MLRNKCFFEYSTKLFKCLSFICLTLTSIFLDFSDMQPLISISVHAYGRLAQWLAC